MRAALLLAVLSACPSPAPAPVPPTGGSGSSTTTAPPVDAPEPTQEERLAAIQKAMNELDEGVQSCWAVAAASERFDIEGTLRARITIGTANVGIEIVEDTIRNAGLKTCMTKLLMGYRWAPPLYDQTIELPFQIKAPADGQNVIDRNLVPWNGQGKVSLAVLLDDALGPARAGQEAELHLGEAELGLSVGGGDPGLTGHRQLEPAAQAGARDRRHDRLLRGL